MKNQNKAFTLVELIVVITIVAILWTIAFLSLQWYSSQSRDSNRIATIKQLETWIEIYAVNTWKYPTPENITWTWKINWIELTNVWIIDENISRVVNVNKIPKDPLSENNYVYWTDANKKYFEIAAVLENLQTNNFKILNSTYAADWYQARVIWNYIWLLKHGNIIYNLPSLLFNSEWIVDLTSPDTYFIVDKWTNIPYSLNTKTNLWTKTTTEILKEITWNEVTLTWITITDFNSQSWTLQQVLWYNIQSIWETVFWKKYLKDNKVTTYLNCTLSWTTINHWQSKDFYSETSISYQASYDCASKMQTRTCTNWNLSWDNSFGYVSCVKWTPNNCSSNWSYAYNWHTYSIPQLNHWVSKNDWITSSNVSENNWIFTYNLTNITCNDWVLWSENETWPTVVSCNSWYIISWNSCLLQVPQLTAAGISFTDTDTNSTQVWGNVTITKASNETFINDYVLYWWSNSTTKLSQTPITTLAKTGSNIIYTITENTTIPTWATHLLVYTKNTSWEMLTWISVAINDNTSWWAPITYQFFNHTGVNQTFTVPAWINQIIVKVWWAGWGGTHYNYGWKWGAGWYTTWTIPVTQWQTLTIIVWGGWNNWIWWFWGWGNGWGADVYGHAAWGWYSWIFNGSVIQSNAIIIAWWGWGWGISNGGAGWGTNGIAGSNDGSATYLSLGGSPWTASAWGIWGVGASWNGTSWSALQWWNWSPYVGVYSGAWGGWWYFGWGGAWHYSSQTIAWWWWGSWFVSWIVQSSSTTAGSWFTPPNTSDGDYITGIGVWGASGDHPGGNGLIKISW